MVRAFDPREVVGSGSSSQVNLVALFLEERLDPIGNPPLHVRVVVAPGTYNTRRSSLLTYEASFLRAAVLVR